MSKVSMKSKDAVIIGEAVVAGFHDGLASVEKEETQMKEEFIVPRKGVVDNCLVLNVRQTASPSGIIETVISKGSEVVINNDETNEFYSIVTSTGIHGFCRKQFITVY